MATCRWTNAPSGPGANMPARWQKWQKLKKRYTKNFRRRIMPCCEIMRWPARSWRMCPWWRISSRPVAGADRKSISGRINPALWPGWNYACSKGTSQSPHTTLTCRVARMMAPQCGQTYLMLRFLLVLRPPLMVVYGKERRQHSPRRLQYRLYG